MKDFIINEKPYELDVDKNGFPCFTKKNIMFISAIIKYDSSYSIAYDTQNPSSSAYLLDKKFPENENALRKAVMLIDKENSTHLIVSGTEKNGGDSNKQGIEITVKSMINKIGLNQISNGIKNGDTSLVDQIADFVDGRYNISFASKFCAYCNRNCFGKDDYSIYDSVLNRILPYYAYVYLDECHWKRITGKNARYESNITYEFADKDGNKNYTGYNDLIGRIIEKVNSVFGYVVTRKEFDWLLWYYFKGDDTRIKKANKCLNDPTKVLSLQ